MDKNKMGAEAPKDTTQNDIEILAELKKAAKVGIFCLLLCLVWSVSIKIARQAHAAWKARQPEEDESALDSGKTVDVDSVDADEAESQAA